MNKLRLALTLVIFGSIGAAGLLLLIPPAAGSEDTAFYSPTGAPLALIDALFQLGAAGFFLLALRRFKPELKTAYRLLAIGAILGSLFVLFDPYTEYYGLWERPFFNTMSYIAYFASSIFLYLGIRRFCQKLDQRSRFMSLPILGGAIAVGLLLYGFVPHIDDWSGVALESELAYDALQVLTITPFFCLLAGGVLAWKLLRHLGQAYKTAFRWLVATLAFMLFNAAGTVIMQLTGWDNWFFNSRFYEVPYIIGNFCILLTGYHFAAVGAEDHLQHGWLGVLRGRRAAAPPTSFDIITYVATMVSDPRSIDQHLDKMRYITATLQSGETPTPTDQAILKDVYLKVEQQLITGDTLRAFDRASLRAEVSRRVGVDEHSSQTFWPQLSRD